MFVWPYLSTLLFLSPLNLPDVVMKNHAQHLISITCKVISGWRLEMFTSVVFNMVIESVCLLPLRDKCLQHSCQSASPLSCVCVHMCVFAWCTVRTHVCQAWRCSHHERLDWCCALFWPTVGSARVSGCVCRGTAFRVILIFILIENKQQTDSEVRIGPINAFKPLLVDEA